MKNKTEKLSLRKFKVVNLNALNSLLGGGKTDDSTLSRTSIGNTDPTNPPTVVSTNPNCN